MARLLSTLPVGKDMEQLLNYYFNIVPMSASLRMYVLIFKSIQSDGIVCLVQDGGTPLMAASFEGHADIAQTLIEAEAQINKQDEVNIFIVYTTLSSTSGLYNSFTTFGDCVFVSHTGWLDCSSPGISRR